MPAVAKSNTPKAHTAQTQAKKKKKTHRFILDCSTVVKDEILDISNFEAFLRDRIKVNKKTGNLGDHVQISLSGDKKDRIHVIAKEPFSKRYLKYLSKKYLKKHQMRDFLHVVATHKASYEFKYFDIHDDNEEEEN